MRNFFLLIFVVFFAFGLAISDAQAKRFGGGRSFGVQRMISSPTQPQSMNAFRQMPGQQSTASKWLGPIAGLIAGGLLASLFMGHGIGTWVVVFCAILLFFSFLRSRKPQLASQSANRSNFNQQTNAASDFMSNRFTDVQNQNRYPAGFDSEGFLRDAKAQFIRLQTAYDQRNLGDLREFTTPEVFAEIKLQLQERGNEVNQTDVEKLDAQLLEIVNENGVLIDAETRTMVASVEFSGSIREDTNQDAHPFNEIWHFKKDILSSHWIVAGIQQQ